MAVDEALLNSLYKGRLEDLREVATQHDLPRSGNVEQLRAKLIAILVLGGVDFSDQGIQSMQNGELSELLGTFGVKKSGSKKQKMQRLWLHLNEDPKRINVDKLPDMTREDLHALCVSLDLPRSGNKTQLMGRVAGIVSSQDGSWGKIKKSLKRGTTTTKLPSASTAKPSSQAVPIPAPEPLQLDHAEEMAESPAVAELVAPMTMPSSTQRASLNELMTAEEIQSLRDRIEQFVEQNSGSGPYTHLTLPTKG